MNELRSRRSIRTKVAGDWRFIRLLRFIRKPVTDSHVGVAVSRAQEPPQSWTGLFSQKRTARSGAQEGYDMSFWQRPNTSFWVSQEMAHILLQRGVRA